MKTFITLFFFLSWMGLCHAGVKNLPRRFLARNRDPRPTVDFVPIGVEANMSSNAVESCGSINDIYSGDSYQMRASSSCSWTFNVKRDVNVDMMCSILDVPCNDAGLNLDFSFTSYDPTVCTGGAAQNVRIALRRRSFRYTVDMTLDPNGQNVEMDCVVVGMGGECREISDTTTTTTSTTTTTTTTTAPPQGDTCGMRRGQKIVNGVMASIEDYPWQAYLRMDNRFACGGTVISPTVVLSAAHCTQGFTPAQIQVRLGCSFLNNCDMIINGVNQVINHENYDFPNFDISIVRLNNALTFTNRIRPACIPDYVAPTNGYIFDIVGYGRTGTTSPTSNSLQMANVRSITDAQCSQVYGNTPFEIVCALPENAGGTCSGDSGGFVGSMNGGRYFVDGVVSFGRSGSCEAGPYGYTEVFRLRNWIAARL